MAIAEKFQVWHIKLCQPLAADIVVPRFVYSIVSHRTIWHTQDWAYWVQKVLGKPVTMPVDTERRLLLNKPALHCHQYHNSDQFIYCVIYVSRKSNTDLSAALNLYLLCNAISLAACFSCIGKSTESTKCWPLAATTMTLYWGPTCSVYVTPDLLGVMQFLQQGHCLSR